MFPLLLLQNGETSKLQEEALSVGPEFPFLQRHLPVCGVCSALLGPEAKASIQDAAHSEPKRKGPEAQVGACGFLAFQKPCSVH